VYPYSSGFTPFPVPPTDHVVCWIPCPQYTLPMMYVPSMLQDEHAERCISKAEVELRSANRLLWEQHVYWTRMTIISLVFNLPDVSFVIARLLQNAVDNGNSIRPYYGDRIADMYSQLIREHLMIAAELVKAAIAGDTKKVADLEKSWYQNGDKIVEFLSTINPYIQREEMRKMFYEHLALTKTEAVSMIQKDYQKSIEIFDQIESQALGMADTISDAIIKQFPTKFMPM
jgi:hypothetical protein